MLVLTLLTRAELRQLPWIVVPGLAMSAAVLFRRRWPVPTLAAVAAAALAQVLAFPSVSDPVLYDAAVLIAMYSVVKYSPPLRDAYLAAAVVTTGIVIQVVRQPLTNWFALAVWYVGVCAGVWFMAYTVRNRRIYVAGLEERAATLEREREHLARIAVADERASIARELHDVVAHSLAVMIVQAEAGRYAFPADPRQALTVLETVAATGREALDDMRNLVGVLRGTEPGDADPAPDRRQVGVDQLGVLADRARSAGLLVSVGDHGGPGPLPAAVDIAVYRVAQEALTNVLRHAGPGTSVAVTVQRSAESVELRVEDDGTAPGAVVAAGGGHGLVGMRERVAVHGGVFAAGPRPGGGWAVTARIPVRPRVADGVPG